MAWLIGGIAVSHTPTIGYAHDAHKQDDPAWAPIFAAFAPVQAWLAQRRPDVLLWIYNDHVTSFFFDHYSAFALGIGDRWRPADEGGGSRALPDLPGHPGLAAHLGKSLMSEEFDLSFFQDKPLDHGCFSPLSVMWPHDAGWPGALVPLQVGVLQFPIPTARRCFRLGQALRRGIESYPEALRVVVVATGGLSHQVHGERAGFNNPAWDHEFVERIEHDPDSLCQLTHAELATRGGWEGAEVIMWLVMRGALSPTVRRAHSDYTLPSMTGIATLIFEDQAGPVDPAESAAHRVRIDAQLEGAEQLPGTYPFDLARSVRAYRINRFLHRLIEPEFRQRFLDRPDDCFAEAGLSEVERGLVRDRDWRGLIQYGAIFFVLEKLAAVVGVSNLHVYAAMRGESLEAFLATRNAPGALYSVAARPENRDPEEDFPAPSGA